MELLRFGTMFTRATILSQMTPVHALPSYSFKTNFNRILLSTPWNSLFEKLMVSGGSRFCRVWSSYNFWGPLYKKLLLQNLLRKWIFIYKEKWGHNKIQILKKRDKYHKRHKFHKYNIIFLLINYLAHLNNTCCLQLVAAYCLWSPLRMT